MQLLFQSYKKQKTQSNELTEFLSFNQPKTINYENLYAI
jgi:hypothetical protein